MSIVSKTEQLSKNKEWMEEAKDRRAVIDWRISFSCPISSSAEESEKALFLDELASPYQSVDDFGGDSNSFFFFLRANNMTARRVPAAIEIPMARGTLDVEPSSMDPKLVTT